LDKVTSVEIGKKTRVFLRFPHVSDALCFSVVCKNRTLDLQASTTQIRDDWVFGLNNILPTALQQQHLSATPPHSSHPPFSPSRVRSSSPLPSSTHSLTVRSSSPLPSSSPSLVSSTSLSQVGRPNKSPK